MSALVVSMHKLIEPSGIVSIPYDKFFNAFLSEHYHILQIFVICRSLVSIVIILWDGCHFDDVIPFNYIYQTKLFNVVVACSICNRRKNDRLPTRDF